MREFLWQRPLAFDLAALQLTALIAGTCLALWLSETVPPFVPSLLLRTLVPLTLGSIDKKFGLQNALSWAIDPVLALFFGGFVLGVATERYGFDKNRQTSRFVRRENPLRSSCCS